MPSGPEPDAGADGAIQVLQDENAWTPALRQRMGDVRVLVERVTEVPRTANGKLRAVVSRLSAADRWAALGGRLG